MILFNSLSYCHRTHNIHFIFHSAEIILKMMSLLLLYTIYLLYETPLTYVFVKIYFLNEDIPLYNMCI